jgi:hypothetical protein
MQSPRIRPRTDRRDLRKVLSPEHAPRGSGRTMARTGLRMMPTFPSPPLKSHTVDFSQYGLKASITDRTCLNDHSVKPTPGMPGHSLNLSPSFAHFPCRKVPGSVPKTAGSSMCRCSRGLRLSTPGVLICPSRNCERLMLRIESQQKRFTRFGQLCRLSKHLLVKIMICKSSSSISLARDSIITRHKGCSGHFLSAHGDIFSKFPSQSYAML